jgi:hypothetical protein
VLRFLLFMSATLISFPLLIFMCSDVCGVVFVVYGVVCFLGLRNV